ncbi:MAG: SH3 domain-containing protein, partial [Saprospiraceae bacterium]
VSRHGKVQSPTLNVRSGPSTSNAKVGLLEQGATVTIFQSTPDGWMRIGANQWVFSKYIQEV